MINVTFASVARRRGLFDVARNTLVSAALFHLQVQHPLFNHNHKLVLTHLQNLTITRLKFKYDI